VVHLEGFPTCETMLLVLTHPQSNVFKMLVCVFDCDRKRSFFSCANVLVAASHEKMLKQLGWKTENLCDNACCETLTAFPTTIPVALTSGLTPVLTVLAAK